MIATMNAKKIAAVKDIVQILGLEKTECILGRAEDLVKQNNHRNMYDVVISRAVAPLGELAQWSKDLLKSGGALLSLKGGNLEEEIKKTKNFNFIRSVEESVLMVKGFDEFMKEEKKIVCVRIQ